MISHLLPPALYFLRAFFNNINKNIYIIIYGIERPEF